MASSSTYSLLYRLLATNAVMVVIVLSFMSYGTDRSLRSLAVVNVSAIVKQTSDTFTLAIEPPASVGDFTTIQKRFDDLLLDNGLGMKYLTLHDQNGDVLVATEDFNAFLPPPGPVLSMEQQVINGFVHVSQPIVLADEEVGELLYGFSVESINRNHDRILLNNILLIVAAMVILAILLTVFGLRISRDLDRLLKASRGWVKGDFSARIDEKGSGEVAQLSHSFNLVAGEVEDTTRRLLQSEARFRNMFEMSPDPSWITDGYKIVECNQKAAATLGYDKSEMLSSGVDRLSITIQAGDVACGAKWYEAIQKTLEKGGCNTEWEFRHKDGGTIPAELHLTRIELDTGPHVFSVWRDVSTRRKVHAQLREAATMFDRTSQGIVIIDLEGNMLDVNPALASDSGYTRDELIGQNIGMLHSKKTPDGFDEEIALILAQEGIWRGERWTLRKNGTEYPGLTTINAVTDDQRNPIRYIIFCSDISNLKESEEQLRHMAHHDALTGLPNRILFNELLDKSIKLASRRGSSIGLVFIDLDRFKYINDTMGHAAGDELLQEVGRRLQQVVRVADTVARISGDEFVILLEDVDESVQPLMSLMEKIMGAFSRPFIIAKQDIQITASMGVSSYPSDGQDSATLLSNSDTAMYKAKEDGRNTYEFYSTDLSATSQEYVFLENELRKAEKDGQLRLVYQPQIDISSGMLTGMEALLRWHHPERGMIPPDQFIPIAEQNGMIHSIGEWVLNAACQQGKAWLDQGLDFGRIAVNISGQQIQRGELDTIIQTALDVNDLPANCLALEVTESFVMNRTQENIDQLHNFRAQGIEIAIDDFGTGYSSLSYLKELPIDKLKIDRSFVKDIPQNANDMAISQAVIALGKALSLKIIAEGVETNDQLEFLRDKGCHEAQGYFHSKPIKPDEMSDFIATNRLQYC